MTDTLDSGRMPDWQGEDAPDRDVVLSSRVRFARNLDNYPFDLKASPDDRAQIRQDVHDVLYQEDIDKSWNDVYVENLSTTEQQLYVERRLASDELTDESFGGVFHTDDEAIGVMVNEEDHVRLQSLLAGNRIEDAFSRARELERSLDQHLPFAYNDQWGFLTSCPTNVGTGLRASLLLHLPGLVMSEKIDRILKAVSNLGLTVRGFSGEGSESRGFYFQLSNQVTLGQSAEEMRDNLSRVSQKIVDQERQARQSILNASEDDTLDQVWRSYGMLKYAQKITTNEALETLSYCRLGVDYSVIDALSLGDIDGLLFLTQPAHLMLSMEDELTSEERDFHRARRIREVVSETDPTNVQPNSGSSESNPRHSGS